MILVLEHSSLFSLIRAFSVLLLLTPFSESRMLQNFVKVFLSTVVSFGSYLLPGGSHVLDGL